MDIRSFTLALISPLIHPDHTTKVTDIFHSVTFVVFTY